ncbi:Methionine adenosyltransferase 2 subunit beta [Nymphon striatum]|nr:Methionine adenosyltransferase 2 subunit beta [Nymphon striatum]
MAKRVMITGATGLLGRAVSTKFSEENWDVTGLANSRAVSPIIKLNLLDSKTLNETISQIKPHIIVHCAAERRPDVVENNYEDCCKLNVGATQVITQAAKANDSTVIFISTDYVFNGKNAPYKACDDVDPLNKYGMSKVEGEKAVLEIDPGIT